MTNATAPKGRPTPTRDDSRNRRPTSAGRFADAGHRTPTGRHAAARLDGLRWLGTSRIIDRAARRKSQRAGWRKLQATARRDYLAAKAAP